MKSDERWEVMIRVLNDDVQGIPPITVLAIRGRQVSWWWHKSNRVVHPRNEKRLDRSIKMCQRWCDVQNRMVSRELSFRESVARRHNAERVDDPLALPAGAREEELT
jgi:hypothetical protein